MKIKSEKTVKIELSEKEAVFLFGIVGSLSVHENPALEDFVQTFYDKLDVVLHNG